MENEMNRDEIQEEVTAEQKSAEETVPVEETVPAEQAAPAEGTAPVEETAPAEEPKPEEKKVTPGKMALMIAAIVAVLALIVALVVGGSSTAEPVETEPVATTEPAPTIPADGNPDDETCKGTYTVTDEEAKAAADVVVATIGDRSLTNGQLQAFYWMQVQNFLASEYGSYMQYYGMLDYTQSLDTQVCAMAETGTWQQFFLKEALTTWQNYFALAEKAEAAGLELTEEEQAFLDSIEENLAANAEYYGLESVEELLKYNIGAGADIQDYAHFQELLMLGNKYYDAEVAKIDPTQEELEAFFAEHEKEYSESGVTREGKYVDVRHVLFTPQGGTTDESGVTTYSDAEWAACEAEAQNVMNAWSKGECDEESFAAMANAYSQDPGSNTNGGLYENVQQGQMVAEFDAWCFDEKRLPGHYGMVKTTYGYHLMYFVGSTPIWEYYSRQDLVTEKTTAMMKALTEEYPMEVSYGSVVLGDVNLAG